MSSGIVPQGVDDQPEVELAKPKDVGLKISKEVNHEKIDIEVGGTGGTKKAMDGDSVNGKHEDISLEFGSDQKLISGTDLRHQPDSQDNLRLMGYKVIETTPSMSNMLPTERLNEQELRETP
mmetsp:Transcript_35757/g.54760  ORF Transcript_35757/g.54760 Transcript_35757/m.54760 type:complete len:122 (-) Transcript_35757:191-556(-)